MDFINENIISYQLIGTKDMTAIPEVQDGSKDYYLVEGVGLIIKIMKIKIM